MRWAPLERGAHRRVAMAIALALAIALPVLALGSGVPGAATAAVGVPPSSERDPCQEPPAREPCRSTVVNGRPWRYALLPATGGESDGAVVVDPGGPGLSILSGEMGLASFAAAHPELSERYALLFVEEPWVTQELAPPCRESLQRFYAALRSPSGAAGAPAEDVTRSCDVGRTPSRWGFSPSDYRAVIARISLIEDIDVVGFLGLSFGSARRSYLNDEDLEWTVLVRPFPVGVTGNELVDARVQVIGEFLSGLETEAGPPGAVPSRSRSVPVTTFDVASARVALGYLSPEEARPFSRGVLSGQDIVAIGKLSDDLWQRYGQTDVSPAYLAYLDEVCTLAGDWPTDLAGVEKERDVLVAAHLPCASVPARGHAGSARWTGPSGCVVMSPSDPVSPSSLVVRELPPGAHVIEAAREAHRSLEGLDACLQLVLPRH